MADEHNSYSQDKRSEVGASSVDNEESKSQANIKVPEPVQGLYISLTTAQAYSVLRNIPKKYRLIERANFKKSTTRKRTKHEQTPKRSKRKEMI
jgi:hypothetical protein